MDGLELASKVSTPLPYFYGKPNATYKVAALDFGIKQNILRQLAAKDCYVKIFPAHTSYQELSSFEPDGYFLSNGPGDPSAMTYAVDTVKQILADDQPLFGICLGNQLLSLACGVGTHKMHNGHRGVKSSCKKSIEWKIRNHFSKSWFHYLNRRSKKIPQM